MKIKQKRSAFFDILIVVIDIVLIVSAHNLSEYIFSGDNVQPLNISLCITRAAVIVFMLYNYDFYVKHIRSKYEILISIAISVFIAYLTIAIIDSVFFHVQYSAFAKRLFVSGILTFIFLSFFKLVSISLAKNISGVSKLLVIESKDADNTLAKKVKYSYIKLYEAWYLFIDVNSEDDIKELIEQQFPKYNSIFLSPNLPQGLRDRLISKAVAQRKEIYILPDLYNISLLKTELVQFEDTPAFRIKEFGLTRTQRAIKRVIDIVAGIVGILLTSPIMLAVAILIKIDSKGPVFYKQERLTNGEKPFKLYKFRTMISNAEQETGPVLATENDSRITRIGKFLRKTRIDEIPQFFNILGGSMSLIGPRPERPVFVEQFKNQVDNYDKRFFVKAGLTGLAQVYARYNTNVADKILYDLLYIKNYSIFMDIKLVLLTIKIVFTKESAEGVITEKEFWA